MDHHTASAAIVASTVDLAKWCELQAQDLDRMHAATACRPMSPQECRHAIDVQREMLRRVGQAHVLWLTLLPGVVASAAPAPAPMTVERVTWVRRLLRRVVG
jgi:hypothetical protein